ncbi:hypothetical protein NDU88_000469 [Pleurodeles waltl]|uniref:Uncharacterized protein n=1 Tax=Pleurodeles waltl TaxID=8319 RepID=A0AAV7WFL9_PLEWA|nr:hypothetical protein NDU88_000469 [Pleurodeles waltl]
MERAALIGDDRMADGAFLPALLPGTVSEECLRGDFPMRRIAALLGDDGAADAAFPPCPPALNYIGGTPPRRFPHVEEHYADQRHRMVYGALLPSPCLEVFAFEVIPVGGVKRLAELNRHESAGRRGKGKNILQAQTARQPERL